MRKPRSSVVYSYSGWWPILFWYCRFALVAIAIVALGSWNNSVVPNGSLVCMAWPGIVLLGWWAVRGGKAVRRWRRQQ